MEEGEKETVREIRSMAGVHLDEKARVTKRTDATPNSNIPSSNIPTIGRHSP